MERGISGSKARLEAIQFKIKKEEEYLKILEERKNEIKKELSSNKFEELIIKGLSKISKKVSKGNNIPFSAFDEIFKNSNNVAQLFTLLSFGNEQNRGTSIKVNNQTEEQKELEKKKD